jgi:threonine dehydratase
MTDAPTQARSVSAAEVEAAARRLAPHLAPTPLVPSPGLSDLLGAEVWLKLETASEIACFKLRGALAALLAADRPAGAVTSSTGNHGQAVALAARRLGIPADIFLPAEPNPVKARMIRLLGARLHLGGADIDDAKDRARAHADRTGLVFVDDGENADLIAGAGTVGLEIGQALDRVDVVYVPMGSGSLAGGAAVGLKSRRPEVRVVAVQAAGSPAMVESFRARRPVERPIATKADCLVCRVPAEAALATLLAAVDDAVTVEETALFSALRTYVERAHVLVELGAAAPLAAAWSERDRLRGCRVVLVVSGANVVTEHLAEALTSPGWGA